MKTYKEFLAEIAPDEKTRETLAAKRKEKEDEENRIYQMKEREAKEREERERIAKIKKWTFKFVKNQALRGDEKCKTLLKLFQNGNSPTGRQLLGILEMIKNKEGAKAVDDFLLSLEMEKEEKDEPREKIRFRGPWPHTNTERNKNGRTILLRNTERYITDELTKRKG